MTKLATMLEDSPYQGYAYAYPHKTAYRRLAEPVELRDLWAGENRGSLFLYIHVPFCEMRCGFCNLFTQANPREQAAENYLNALEREAGQVREALGDARFARLAIGGGTPTFLDTAGLDRLFRLAQNMGVETRHIPLSIETSPGTVTDEKLSLLKERGVTRISIGIQSFDEAEASALQRPQRRSEVDVALTKLKQAKLPILNLDLMYGLPGQTVASWLTSLRTALEHEPEELYLYPLYVRPGTGLGRSAKAWDDLRLSCYREGRQVLLERGYQQMSMRMFRAEGVAEETGPVYCCQEDGMVGLGCGARSYTQGLHYSNEYAVGAASIRSILEDYGSRPSSAFHRADHGFRLDADEQRRRFLVQSLLQTAGLSFTDYRLRFGNEACADFPDLRELAGHGLAERSGYHLRLTTQGMERSDVIGPWLYSNRVVELMRDYDCR